MIGTSFKNMTAQISICCILVVCQTVCLAQEDSTYQTSERRNERLESIPKSYLKLLDKPSNKDAAPTEYKNYKCVKYSKNGIPEKLSVMWYRTYKECVFPKESAFAFLWHDDSFLYVCAIMEDSDVKSRAVGKNDFTYMKGDVMELFFQPAGAPNYYELHLAQNLATLELSYPSVKAFKNITSRRGLAKFFFDSGFKCKTGKFLLKSGTRGWWGYMKVPLSKMGTSVEKLTGSKIVVCRYNYNSAWEKKPEVSTSATIKKGTFHQPSRWHILEK